MKKLNTLLLFVLTAAGFSSTTAQSNTSLPARQEERTLPNFKGISAGGPINIKVILDNKESIRFEGDKDAIAELTTEVISGVLTIKPRTKWSDWSRRYSRPGITAYISAKKINSLSRSGSGSMEVEGMINGSELVASLSGSGSIMAAGNISRFTADISGSGTMEMKGKADHSNLTLSGSGNFRGKGFSVNDVSVQISGSADVFIRANSRLEAVISGSGNITYTGDAVVKRTILGSGAINKG